MTSPDAPFAEHDWQEAADRDRVPMFTGRYPAVAELVKAGESLPFVPVKTSVGHPRWIPGQYDWPRIGLLAPYGLMGVEDRDEFLAGYRRLLDGHGVSKIGRVLSRVHESQPGDPPLPLLLLCYEDLSKPNEFCHRRAFAAWWLEQTGQLIEDLNDPAALRALGGG